MELPEDMGFNDEDYCTLFRLPSEAYPKVKYFRDRLKDFYPRLIRTLDKLPKGLRNDDELPSLDKRIRSVTSSPHLEIAVFGPGNTKFAFQQLLKDYTEYDEVREILHLTDIEGWNDSEATKKPLIGIYTMNSSDIEKFVGSVRPPWLEETFHCYEQICFIRDRKNEKKDDISAHLQDVFKAEHKTYNMGKVVVFQSERDALSTTLSKILEEIMVMAFVHIENYICSVTKVSKLRGNRPITLDELFSDFKTSIEAMLADNDLPAICPKETHMSYFGLCLADRAAILLASKLVAIFKIPGPAIHSFLYASKWREETKEILLNLHDLLEKSHKDDQTKPKIESTLPKFPEEKEKGLDEKSSQLQSMVTQQEKQKEILNADRFSDEFEKLKKPIKSNIRALKSAQPFIATLKRLHFEMKGILKERSMQLCTGSEFSEERDATGNPVKSKDPYEKWTQSLHKKLKDVPFRTGKLFGNFCVFIDGPNMKNSEEIKRKIGKVLDNFPYEYEVRIIDKPRCFANGHEIRNAQQNVPGVFKMGMSCRSQGMTMAGTIGLFLKLKNEPDRLFFVTSAHVVPDRGNQVEVPSVENNWVNLGFASVVIPSDTTLVDITAVEVFEQMREYCVVEIEDDQADGFVEAEVFDTNIEELIKLEGQDVSKKGAITGVTNGIVSSLYDPNHLLVSPKSGSESRFAEGGDSGAIVYFDAQDGKRCLLSMIMGEASGMSKQFMNSETNNIHLDDDEEGTEEEGNMQSTDDQIIFTTLFCKGLEELRIRNLELEV